ncbi:MAG: translocation/assembly module TamB domain-containing protein [Candidatus Aquilonibacter sp.]
MRRRTAWTWTAIALVVVGLLAISARTLLARALPFALGLALHGNAHIAQVEIGGGHMILRGVHVTTKGDPLLDAREIRVDYSLRDLLPGSMHRFGLLAIDIDRPVFTFERRADGGYNLALGGGAPSHGPAVPQRLDAVPIAFTLRVHDGAIALREPRALDPQSRSIDVAGMQLDATVNTATRTHYRLRATFAGAPLRIGGTVDATRGYAMNRVQVGALAMRPIANFFINSKASKVLAGTARDIDLRIYALGVEPEAPVDYHLSGHAIINDASMMLVGLAQPVQQLQGTLQLVDDQLVFNDLRAQVAGLAMTGVGSIFEFPATPQFRIGISGRGNLANLRTLFTFAKDQPMAGDARIGVAVDGGLDDPGPRIQATVDAPHFSYRGIIFDSLRARVAYSNSTVFFMPLEAKAEGSTFTIRGALEIGDTSTVSRVVLHIDAPADSLPYVGELLGHEPLTGDILLHGKDLNFYGYGALQSARDVSRMAAVVHADPGGVLDVGPLWFDTERGRLYAGYSLDRTHDTSAFWIHAHNLTLRTPRHTSFLGVTLPIMPPLDGTIDDAAILGGGPSGEHTLIAGRVLLHATTIAGVRLDSVRTNFAGTLADAALDPIDASGPWGTLHGTGALSLNSLAVHGHYVGTLEGLRPFLNQTPASGAIDGNVALAIASQGIIVQADDLHLQHATIHGLPLSQVTGTLAIRNGALQIKSARATIASGTVVAAGSYDRGIALVATHLDGGQLRALGLPLDAGTVDASGTLAQGVPLPTFNGGVAVANGRVQRFAVAGSSLIALHGDGVQLAHTVGGMDNIYAIASGSLQALTSGAPVYDVTANVPAGDLRTVVNDLGIVPHYAEGTVGADVAVHGAGLQPQVSGPIAVSSGSINGLYFIDASGVIDADTSGVAVQDGAVTIGSTQLAFNAIENPSTSALQLEANDANLSDFDNFFDTGDTLNGIGPVRFDVLSQAHRLSSNGAINIAHLRYRTLPIGTTVASWSSAHNVLQGSLDVSGEQGSLRSHGSIAVAQEQDLFHIVRDSSYAITAQLSDVDLSTWIAALGAPQVAVTGRVNANATLDGRWPDPIFKGAAELDNATLWRFPIDKATATFSTSGQRVLLNSATVAAPGITAEAYGSMGFSLEQPLQFTLHASSSDLPQLAMELWRRQLPISGSFESTLTLGGTPANPLVNATFDGTKAVLYGVSVPSLHGAVALERHKAVLHDASITLPKGVFAITGSAPIEIDPFAIGPPKAPVSVNVTAKDIDPSAFDVLLGNNTKFGGTINGDLAISGTVVNPQISGSFSIDKGTYVSDLSRTPITGIEAALNFDHSSALINKLQANFGSGTISATGSIAFGANPTYIMMATARGAQLNLPTYGTGTLDGAIALVRNAGAPALLSGKVELSNAAIPFSAFLAAAQNNGAAVKPPPLDLNVDMVVGKNVRVRGSGFGAGLDIGATGSGQLGGTLAAPTMAGTFSATSGTLTYYDRAFRVQSAKVVFRPDNGIIPTITATGTTHVTNPDPNSPYSGVDVTVSVEGQVTNPKISFASNPPGYSNEQILAMIAPFGGVILSGLSYAPSLNAYGAVPGQQIPGNTGTFSAGQEAFNILNAQFAAGLLNPVEGALSQGLGVQNVNLTLDYWGNVGFSASRLLGKTVNFIYAATFGIPQRTSFGLQLTGERTTSAQLTFFFENGPQRLFEIPAAGAIPNERIYIGQPLLGQQGFAFTFQRLFW